jgi:ABC-type multidrug transport system fused ATPase/permease subunit
MGVRLVHGDIGFQSALTVLVLAPELYMPLRNLAAGFHASADGAAVADRLLTLIEQPVAVPSGSAVPPSVHEMPIRFEAVSFAYPDRPVAAVSGIELELAPGETVALVGPSGGGKSTLASLLLRFHEPVGGRILLGDVDLAGCDATAWRRQIAWVPQSPTLFRGTVADNIRLGDRDAPDDRVVDAARQAGADSVIEGLPDGYATVVGEGARPLSTGERQRIALARAFLRDAPLIVLDEPTANLDPASARAVTEAVDRLRPGRTMLLIAHDVDLAARADRVVTLAQGQIVAAPV